MASRPKAVQLRHPDAVRAQQRKVGRSRKLAGRMVLAGGISDNRRHNPDAEVGLDDSGAWVSATSSFYARAYET